MAEILLDTKFWNKVFKLLEPATVIAIRANKGSGKDKMIPSNGMQSLDEVSNNFGFLLGFIDQHYGWRLASYYTEKERLENIQGFAYWGGLKTPMIKEAEKAIVRVAITDGLLPESTLYDGKVVIEPANPVSGLSQDFGFVYFIRNTNIYKIGITDNLLRRMKELKPDEILNSIRCSNYQEIEKKMHAHFKKRRIPQTEYFRLDTSEIEEAHVLMTEMAIF